MNWIHRGNVPSIAKDEDPSWGDVPASAAGRQAIADESQETSDESDSRPSAPGSPPKDPCDRSRRATRILDRARARPIRAGWEAAWRGAFSDLLRRGAAQVRSRRCAAAQFLLSGDHQVFS